MKEVDVEKPKGCKSDSFKPCAGMRCRIVGVDILACGACRLMEMGLTPGTEFTVLKIAPLGDPFEIDVRGGRVCLRRREAECLTVEPVV